MEKKHDTRARRQAIEDGVHGGDVSGIRATLDGYAPTSAMPVREVVEALTRGMERARADLKNAGLSVPEFLFVVDAFREGIRLVRQAGGDLPEPEARVLIGVVEGEVHDLGKNIVAAVLEASGFRVIDPGRELSRDRLLDAIGQYQPSIVALSAMMSTCIPGMRDTVAWVRKLHPEIRVLLGGAALDAELAAGIGAHGYAESAATAPDEARRLLHAV